MEKSKFVFNADKTLDQYKKTPLFCGPEPGLMDTIYKPYPKLWSLYKELKSLDWSEDEFDYSRCLLDFKKTPINISTKMIRTIGWQWEADSVAGRSILAIMAPFVSSTEYWTALVRIADNENIHGATYSEIVKLSFDNTDEVMQDILDFKAKMNRMHVVEETLAEALYLSRQYAAGNIPMSDELYRDVVIKTTIIAYYLERVQFMASFGITFIICESGVYQPIGKAVQKICQDELEIHAEFDREVLMYELQTEKGRWAVDSLKDWINLVHHEVIETEHHFIDVIHEDGYDLPGTNKNILKDWVLFNAKDPGKFFNVETDIAYPRQNPMPILEKWINMNLTQAAPQEQDIAQYKVGIVHDDSQDIIFDY